MKQFTRKLTLFAVLVGVVMLAFELVIRSMTDNSYSYKHTYIQQNGERINTLILGASHPYFGISPTHISDSAFSLAQVSQPIRVDYELLQAYNKYMPHLKTVILGISYLTLREIGLKDNEGWYNINYNLYMDVDVDSPILYNWAIFDQRYWLAKVGSLFSEVEASTCDTLGWGTNYSLEKKPKQWDTKLSDIAVERHTISDTTYLADNKRTLQHILELCRDNGYRLIIVTTPVYHTYYERVDEEQYTEIHHVISDFQKKYTIEYYDFLKDPRFEPDDFYDGDHLSNIGARKLSLILADTLHL